MRFTLITFVLCFILMSCYEAAQENPLVDNLPTCYDKIKNQDETNIDCGGRCLACYDPPPCLALLKDNEIKLGTETIMFTSSQVLAKAEYSYYYVRIPLNGMTIEISIPSKENQIPSANQRYSITSDHPSTMSGANIYISQFYSKNSIAGYLYYTIDKTRITMEFCDVTMKDYSKEYKMSGRVICIR